MKQSKDGLKKQLSVKPDTDSWFDGALTFYIIMMEC